MHGFNCNTTFENVDIGKAIALQYRYNYAAKR